MRVRRYEKPKGIQVRYDSPPTKPNITSLTKVISGGQIGIDIAALRAAKQFRPLLKTGGHMPEGYETLSGKKKVYSLLYSCVDDSPAFTNGKADYKARTWKNVEEADATIRIATNFFSPGELCTLNAIRYYNKIHLDIFLQDSWIIDGQTQYGLTPIEVANWVTRNRVQVLNIAGNANPALESTVFDYLTEVFNIIYWE